jgi:hypothetical protein
MLQQALIDRAVSQQHERAAVALLYMVQFKVSMLLRHTKYIVSGHTLTATLVLCVAATGS